MAKPTLASSLSSVKRPWKSPQMPKRNASPTRWMVLGVVGILALGLIGLGLSWLPGSFQGPLDGFKAAFPSLGPALPTLQQERVLLVMGVDAPPPDSPAAKQSGYKGVRTDTMLLVRLAPQQEQMAVVSLPRDSKVYLNERGQVGKLNSAFAIGGANYAREVVRDAFGIPVHHYVVVNFSAVHELVDAIGGVDITVEKAMRYRDRSANLTINFKPGRQHMNGEQAEAYLRFRHDALGDIGRIRRQQHFLSALKQRLSGLNGLGNLPALLEKKDSLIQTNLSTEELLAIANFSRKLPSGNIRLSTLPGHSSTREVASYWIINPVEATHMLNRLIFDNQKENKPTIFNPAPSNKSRYEVSLLYSREQGPLSDERLTELKTSLAEQGFDIVCQRQAKLSGGQILETSYDATPEGTKALQKALPEIGTGPIWFHPRGATYEELSCSPKADYSVMLPTR